MKKSDLKVGDVVKTREGKYLVILPNDRSKDGLATFSANSYGCHNYLHNYNEDLSLSYNSDEEYDPSCDIVAVYKASEPNKNDAYRAIVWILSNCTLNHTAEEFFKNLNWDWVRPESVKEMTMEELEKHLGYKVKIVKEHTN